MKFCLYLGKNNFYVHYETSKLFQGHYLQNSCEGVIGIKKCRVSRKISKFENGRRVMYVVCINKKMKKKARFRGPNLGSSCLGSSRTVWFFPLLLVN